MHSTTDRTATFSFGPAYWAVLRVNGAAMADDSVEGNTLPCTGLQIPTKIGATLRAGWNRIEVAVCAVRVPQAMGYDQRHRLGFIMHTEDPGDLLVEPAADEPAPPSSPGRHRWATAPVDLYVEPLLRGEEPYRFNVY